MSYTTLGAIPNKGSLISQKQQRKKGGSKNVYILGMSPDVYRGNANEIKNVIEQMGGERYERDNAYLFRKKPAAEKAWTWFVLRWS